MHIAYYLEEDFRLATAVQVRNYTSEEREVRPHLPGFALIQLCDQLNGHILTVPQPRFLLVAPGGTAYWLARHLLPRAEVQLWLPSSQMGVQIRHLLAELPLRAAVESEQLPPEIFCRRVTCTVLACLPSEVVFRYDHYRQHASLGRRPILAYDPERRLKQRPEGEYFLGSSIWVTRDHGH